MTQETLKILDQLVVFTAKKEHPTDLFYAEITLDDKTHFMMYRRQPVQIWIDGHAMPTKWPPYIEWDFSRHLVELTTLTSWQLLQRQWLPKQNQITDDFEQDYGLLKVAGCDFGINYTKDRSCWRYLFYEDYGEIYDSVSYRAPQSDWYASDDPPSLEHFIKWVMSTVAYEQQFGEKDL